MRPCVVDSLGNIPLPAPRASEYSRAHGKPFGVQIQVQGAYQHSEWLQYLDEHLDQIATVLRAYLWALIQPEEYVSEHDTDSDILDDMKSTNWNLDIRPAKAFDTIVMHPQTLRETAPASLSKQPGCYVHAWTVAGQMLSIGNAVAEDTGPVHGPFFNPHLHPNLSSTDLLHSVAKNGDGYLNRRQEPTIDGTPNVGSLNTNDNAFWTITNSHLRIQDTEWWRLQMSSGLADWLSRVNMSTLLRM